MLRTPTLALLVVLPATLAPWVAATHSMGTLSTLVDEHYSGPGWGTYKIHLQGTSDVAVLVLADGYRDPVAVGVQFLRGDLDLIFGAGRWEDTPRPRLHTHEGPANAPDEGPPDGPCQAGPFGPPVCRLENATSWGLHTTMPSLAAGTYYVSLYWMGGTGGTVRIEADGGALLGHEQGPEVAFLVRKDFERTVALQASVRHDVEADLEVTAFQSEGSVPIDEGLFQGAVVSFESASTLLVGFGDNGFDATSSLWATLPNGERVDCPCWDEAFHVGRFGPPGRYTFGVDGYAQPVLFLVDARLPS